MLTTNACYLYTFYRWILAYQHVSPVEAVQIHLDILTSFSIGMHWGTFNMSSCEVFLLHHCISLTVDKAKMKYVCGSGFPYYMI